MKHSTNITYPIIGKPCFHFWLTCFVLQKKSGNLRNSVVSRKVFSWRFLVYFISTEKWNEKREIPWWSSNLYFFARASICFTSKISKEIWQIVIWSENVFKGNLMLQWLQEFCQGKVSGWWTLDELQYENGWRYQL